MPNSDNKPTLFFTTKARLGKEQFNRIKDQLTQSIPDARVVILEDGIHVQQMWTGDPAIIAQAFHEAYERLAPAFDYETREASAVAWEDVPTNNKELMIATVEQLIEDGVIA